MNERTARDVVLMRAIETADTKREILSEDDRVYASRSARELAHWQAAEGKSEPRLDHFLGQRAELILKRLAERTPAFAAFRQRRSLLPVLAVQPPVPSSPDIHLLRFRGRPPHRQIAMVWRRSSAMGEFLKQLAAEFRSLPEQLLRPPQPAPSQDSRL